MAGTSRENDSGCSPSSTGNGTDPEARIVVD